MLHHLIPSCRRAGKILALSLAIVFSHSAVLFAQGIVPAVSQLDFGDVITDAPDSLELIINNPNADAALIGDVDVYHPAFWLRDTVFSIPAAGSYSLWVHFAPRHNVFHNTELVLYPADGSGNLAVDLIGRGVYPEAYYSSTQDLSEEALKTALTNLIDGHTSLGYTPARDQMYLIIDNWKINGRGSAVNKLETAYIGRIASGWANRSDAQTSHNVNTEHTFPQSTFSSSEPMQSDIYHLFITDAPANSARGNLPFGLVSSPTWTDGGSKKDANRFEPRDVQKGPTSRAMLYFLIRYGNPSSFVNGTQEGHLVNWNQTYPPDSIERRRNDDIHSVQNNRNPFIDHPEFAERIHSFINTSVAPIEPGLVITELLIDFGTIDVGDTAYHDLLMVGDGNVDAVLNSVLTSSPEFLILIEADTLVEAGESARHRLAYAPIDAGIDMESLDFNTDVPGMPTVAVDLRGGATALGLDASGASGASGLTLSPNPASDAVTIEFDRPGDGTLVLYDAKGRRLQQHPIRGLRTTTLALDEITQGIYLLRWTDDRGVRSKRLVVH